MEKQVVEYNITDAAIAEMKSLYMGLEITDLEDKEQFDAVHSARMVVRGKRIEVDKKRKELKADALAWSKAVQDEANRIFALIEPIEGHLKAEEDKIAQEKQRIEDERIAEVKERLDLLRSINIPQTRDGLEAAINRMETNLEITPEKYFEFTAEAFQIKQDKITTARATLETRIRLDQEEAERKAEDERLAAEREKQEKEAAKLREEQEKLLAAQKKIDDEKAALEAEKKAEQERKDREEFERKAKEQAEKDAKEAAERAMLKKIEREKAEEAEKERQARLLPDKEKLSAFCQFLTDGMEYPEVDDDEAQDILAQVEIEINDTAEKLWSFIVIM